MQTIRITKDAARAFLIRSFALESWQGIATVDDALRQLEFVQEDSISICGRMHDLILWPRVAGYTPEKLAETLYGPSASAFEIHFPNLAALPRNDYRYFVPRMRRKQVAPGRWEGLFPHEEPVALAFLEALDSQGPLSTRKHGNDFGHMLSGWGTRSTVLSQVVEKLWLHGTLSIAHRKNFERYFDRTERVAAELAAHHAEDAELPDTTEIARYLTRKRLRAKALFRPRRDDLATLGESAFCKVEIDGLAKPWYCLAEQSPSLTELGGEQRTGGCQLLAPLDPLLYDRQRTREIFDFDYTWEVYVPAAKRKWGYYVLPILQGDRLVGRVDPKLDRKSATLQILSLQLDPAADRQSVLKLLEDFAVFLGAEKLAILPANG